MSKTPVMVLQEVMAKKRSLPHYDLIHATTGTHINTFTIRVRCTDLTAEGTGSTKKEAKQNAAKEMLYKLKEAMHISKSSLIPITTPEKSVVPVELHQSFSSVPVTPTCTSFVNAVGRLHEYCVQNNFPEPRFDIVNITGPSHNSVFTMTCVVSSVQVEASAPNKKLAKHEVAKKMLDCLIKVKSELKDDLDGIDIMKLTLEEPICPHNKAKEIIKVKYPKLTKLVVRTINEIQVSDLHAYMKSIYSLEERDTITKKLERFIFDIKKHSEITLSDLKNVLESISTVFNVEIRRINFVVKKTCKMIGFQLNTRPEIIQISCADNEIMAEVQAIKEVIKTIMLLLK